VVYARRFTVNKSRALTPVKVSIVSAYIGECGWCLAGYWCPAGSKERGRSCVKCCGKRLSMTAMISHYTAATLLSLHANDCVGRRPSVPRRRFRVVRTARGRSPTAIIPRVVFARRTETAGRGLAWRRCDLLLETAPDGNRGGAGKWRSEQQAPLEKRTGRSRKSVGFVAISPRPVALQLHYFVHSFPVVHVQRAKLDTPAAAAAVAWRGWRHWAGISVRFYGVGYMNFIAVSCCCFPMLLNLLECF